MTQPIRTQSNHSLPTLTVASQAAAQALLNAKSRRTLAAFLTPRSLSEAARDLDQPLNTVKYQLRRLLSCGLLLPEEGRPPRYRAAQVQFFVPYELTSAHWPQEVLSELHLAWDNQLAGALLAAAEEGLIEHGLWGVQVVPRAQTLRVEHAVWHAAEWNFTAPDAPAILDAFDTLQLDYADAKRFQTELMQLIARYRALGGSQPHLLRLTLVQQQSNYVPAASSKRRTTINSPKW